MTRRQSWRVLGLAVAMVSGQMGVVAHAGEGERRDGDYPAAAVQNFLNGQGDTHLPQQMFERGAPTALKNLHKDADNAKGANSVNAPSPNSPR